MSEVKYLILAVVVIIIYLWLSKPKKFQQVSASTVVLSKPSVDIPIHSYSVNIPSTSPTEIVPVYSSYAQVTAPKLSER